MRLAVSNIAWDPSEDAEVADVLAEHDVRAVELAPTKLFDDPLAASAAEVDAVARWWADRGLPVVAFQSMLFGHPELLLFGDEEARRATVETLVGFVGLAARMGAHRLVFGSPANRRVPPGMPPTAAAAAAVDAFRRIGDAAADADVVFCIEPNPEAYGCDFVTTAAQGAELVEAVSSPGFGLHLDAAGMTLAGDDPAVEVRRRARLLRHVHASAPGLGELEDEVVPHSALAAALVQTGYPGHVSVEMRPGRVGEGAARVDRAVRLARRHYGPEPAPAESGHIVVTGASA